MTITAQYVPTQLEHRPTVSKIANDLRPHEGKVFSLKNGDRALIQNGDFYVLSPGDDGSSHFVSLDLKNPKRITTGTTSLEMAIVAGRTREVTTRDEYDQKVKILNAAYSEVMTKINGGSQTPQRALGTASINKSDIQRQIRNQAS